MHFRRRTGGIEWRLFSDPEKARRYLETYLVGSWDEHERQHTRATKQDAELVAQIDGLLAAGVPRRARHYLAVGIRERRV